MFTLDGYIHDLREVRELGVDKISCYIRIYNKTGFFQEFVFFGLI